MGRKSRKTASRHALRPVCMSGVTAGACGVTGGASGVTGGASGVTGGASGVTGIVRLSFRLDSN